MSAERLIALYNELRSLDRKRFLSTRQQRRRETLLRQIPVARLEAERAAEKQKEREEIHKRVIEYRRGRRKRRRLPRETPKLRVAKLRKTRAAFYCVLCGKRMRGRKRKFCGQRCRQRASKVPKPSQVRELCDKINSRWDDDEKFKRSGRLGGGKWRVVAQIIENYGRRHASVKQSPEAHDKTYHGNKSNRVDNDYWNQTSER